MKHPFITMTKARSKVWKNDATDEDFMLTLRSLAKIYAVRKNKELSAAGNGYDTPDIFLLFKDYKEWIKDN